jgi:hypothetical protein
MQELVKVANINDFKPDTMRMVNIGGHEYLITQVEDKYYAAGMEPSLTDKPISDQQEEAPPRTE